MSGKNRREIEDQDIEVGDRDRHRRTVQSDIVGSSSSITSKRIRRDEEKNIEKELINELSSNSNIELNKKR
jgi:hypothetical protein